MKKLRAVKGTFAVAMLMCLAILTTPGASRAGSLTVAAGWDLYQTDPIGTVFPGLGQLQGVALNNYNFGGAIGVKNVGNTDTIIQRLNAATVASAGDTANAINIQVSALQLKTANQVNFLGNGLDTYFLTLSATKASTGTETITFANANGGTFSSALDLNFDIHKGSLNGAIVDSGEVNLQSNGTPWGRTPPAGSVTIAGVNLNLNGVDNSQDFWVNPPLNGPVYGTPEPSSWTLLVLNGLGVIGFYWRRRRTLSVA